MVYLISTEKPFMYNRECEKAKQKGKGLEKHRTNFNLLI